MYKGYFGTLTKHLDDAASSTNCTIQKDHLHYIYDHPMPVFDMVKEVG